MLEVKAAIAKTNKYSVSESGDSVEVTERPRGGISIILADAQGSGRSARTNSQLVVAKCAGLISEGARDGAAARTVHDMLYALRDGRVSATLVIASADLESQSIVISQNGGPPVYVLQDGNVLTFDSGSNPIGVHRSMKPNVFEFNIEKGLAVVGMTDGISAAGRSRGKPWQDNEIAELIAKYADDPKYLADLLLEESVARDDKRPQDDMALFVIYVDTYEPDIKIRKMTVNIPC